MTASTEDLLTHLRAQIESWIAVSYGNQEPQSLYAPVNYILSLGGKRVRPTLSLLAAGMVNADPNTAKNVALSVEYLHNFTLMHDDIMDSADSRRGQQTVHTKWDESTAILSGDVMFTMAMQILMDGAKHNSSQSANYLLMTQIFLEVIREVCEGQALDMLLPTKLDALPEDYMQMIKGKTAVLIGGSLQLGALAAGATKEVSVKFYELGIDIGLAFQLQDDLLDLTGDEKITGKRFCGDIYEKKKTWLYLQAVNQANKADNAFLKNIFQENYEVTSKDVDHVLRIMEKLGIFKQCEDIMLSYYQMANTLLDSFTSSPYKTALTTLLQSLLKRDH